MKLKVLLFFLIVHCLIMPTSAQPFRYAEKIFTEIDTFKNIEYANAPWLSNPIALLADYNIHEGEATTENRPLLMDIFIPENDTLSKRPAIIFLHGGAFILGSRHNEDMIAMCDSFARRGYVTATIDYRLGMGANVNRIFGIPVGIHVSKSNARRAVYRATQDSRAAVRFLKHHARNYGIDTSKIFMAGSSAGAIATLNNFYLGDNEIPPETAQNPDLGGIDGTGISGYNGTADAAISFWGALENLNIIENKQAPVFLVHGTEDNIVPFKKGIPLEGIVPPNQLITFDMPETYGSYCIDTFLTNRDIFPDTWFVENQNHEFYGVNTGEFNDGGTNEYWDLTMMKTSEFLFEQIKPVADFDFEITENVLTLTILSSASDFVLWDFGDGTTSKAWEPTHIYEKEGTYTISLTVCNEIMACDAVSKEVNYSVTNATNELSEQIKIFPNPVSDQMKIKGFAPPFDVAVYNLTGQVQHIKKNILSGYLNVSPLKNGIYILEIKTDDNSFVQRFIKRD